MTVRRDPHQLAELFSRSERWLLSLFVACLAFCLLALSAAAVSAVPAPRRPFWLAVAVTAVPALLSLAARRVPTSVRLRPRSHGLEVVRRFAGRGDVVDAVEGLRLRPSWAHRFPLPSLLLVADVAGDRRLVVSQAFRPKTRRALRALHGMLRVASSPGR